MNRSVALLRKAAVALEDGRDPLSTAFLAEHAVTYDECMALSDHLAMGARLLAYAVEHPAEALGAVNGANLAGAYRLLHEGLAAYAGVEVARP